MAASGRGASQHVRRLAPRAGADLKLRGAARLVSRRADDRSRRIRRSRCVRCDGGHSRRARHARVAARRISRGKRFRRGGGPFAEPRNPRFSTGNVTWAPVPALETNVRDRDKRGRRGALGRHRRSCRRSTGHRRSPVGVKPAASTARVLTYDEDSIHDDYCGAARR